jgi:hypothetical protein
MIAVDEFDEFDVSSTGFLCGKVRSAVFSRRSNVGARVFSGDVQIWWVVEFVRNRYVQLCEMRSWVSMTLTAAR